MNGLFGRIDKAVRTRHMYIFPLFIAVPIAYFLFFQLFALGELTDEKLQEKLVETDRAVNIIADDIRYEVTTREDWNTYDYNAEMKNFIGLLDDDNKIFACAYRGGDLTVVSEIHPIPNDGSSRFDPMAYADFVAAVKEKIGIKGVYPYTVWYEDEYGARDVYLRYRWVPVLDDVEDPFLIVIGVSKNSISTAAASWLTVGIVVIGGYLIAQTVICAGLYITRRKDDYED